MKFFIFIFNFLLFFQSIYSETHFISIGRDCQAAKILQTFNIRKAAYPMDWMICNNFEKVSLAFQEDFIHFLNPKFLEYKKTSIYNSHYEFYYNHFFPLKGMEAIGEVRVGGILDENFLSYLPIVKNVQGKRIDRLLNLLKSKDRIIFIRTHANSSEASIFVNTIKNKYPKLDFLLVVINEHNNSDQSWEIPEVINFFLTCEKGRVWWDRTQWDSVLRNLQSNYYK